MRPVQNKKPLLRKGFAYHEQASLHWTCWDNSKTVLSLVHVVLHGWTIDRGIQLQRWPVSGPFGASQPLGLAIWAGWENRDFDLIGQSVMNLRETHPEAVLVVFAAESCSEQSSRQVQVGAHLVLNSLCHIQQNIAKILTFLPLSNQDTNRLTHGLVQRIELTQVNA